MTKSDGFSSSCDEDVEQCPLCIEDMELSDKRFKPCPCGYQICQFCYNTIRRNPEQDGKCPNCRRPYDDESVEFKALTPEELKADMQKAKKDKERKNKEKEKKEVEQAQRKHLAGMRVIQKNLVYVIGFNPKIPDEELQATLSGDQFFGQYGKIQKLVVSRRNGGGIGVYVTYQRKEDAARCIAAVDGTINDNKILRAAYGTTKYCSYYLRGQTCPNPNCMFLHQPGEEADSYTRQDLSTMQHSAKQGHSGAPGTTGPPSVSGSPASAKPAAMNGGTAASKSNVSSRSASVNLDNRRSVTPEASASPTAPWAKPAAVVSHIAAPISTQTSRAPTPQAVKQPSHLLPHTQPNSQSQLYSYLANTDLYQSLDKTVEFLAAQSNVKNFKIKISSSALSELDLKQARSMPPLFSFSKPDKSITTNCAPPPGLSGTV
ncbi:hypothetical protein CANCADRAFT_2062 [Tortispora caseinolytica NRRL Y-17796]|uniref:RING-type domain-containing protein n=1 Tax=Tortispora caseinolytica NRRL Y-17796 TaxID=767744 RepID=A0A1E4TF00_9ASCO|nr:hypothetical protein CANCADRAFT_2062 [Tortispora caseinolytica NRRL Y-17796]